MPSVGELALGASHSFNSAGEHPSDEKPDRSRVITRAVTSISRGVVGSSHTADMTGARDAFSQSKSATTGECQVRSTTRW
jgi:hypothetical protein